MMDNYVGLIICGFMAVTLVAVLYFDSRSTRNIDKDKDADISSKDEEDETK